MTKSQLIKLCQYYKGEAQCPEALNQSPDGELWEAEQYVCENLCNKINGTDPQLSLAEWVAAFVSKWDSYGWRETMAVYLAKTPGVNLELD
jgi:hypothetical protein